jgi:hypothetical protein
VIFGQTRNRVLHLCVALLTLGTVVPTLGHGLMLYDLGELAFYVDAIRAGGTPGVDFVVNGYGPGRYYLLAGIVSLFPTPLLAYSVTFLVLRLVTSALLLELGLRLLPRSWALLPVAAILVAPGPLHKGFFAVATLALALAAVAYLQRTSAARALAFGVVLAATALFRVDLGLFGGLVWLALASRAHQQQRWQGRQFVLGMLPLLAGALAALGGFLALYGGAALSAVWAQVWADAAMNQSVDLPTFPGPAQLLGPGWLDALFLWLPLAVYPLLCWRWWRGGPVLGEPRGEPKGPGESPREAWLALGLLGVLVCNQVRMKPEFGHLLQAGPLLYLAFALLGAEWSARRAATARRWGLAEGLGLALPVLLLANALFFHRGDLYTGSVTIPWQRDLVLQTPFGSARLGSGERATLGPLLAYLEREVPTGPLWVPTHQPLLYALSGRADVTGVPALAYYAQHPLRQEQILAALEADLPEVVVFVDNTIEGPRLLLKNAAPRVHAWLQERYQPVRSFDEFQVLLPR